MKTTPEPFKVPLKLISILTFFIVIFGPNSSVYGQSVKRQVVSCMGSSAAVQGAVIMQTAGQCYATSNTETSVVLQGFQQPVVYVPGKRDSLTLLNSRLYIFPVPATANITVETEEMIGNATITVTDITGKEVYMKGMDEFQRHTISCESWVNGVYFITIRDGQQNSRTTRVVVTK